MDSEDVLRGSCDICGLPSDGSIQECNVLSCTYAGCKEILYHQACLDKFLRSNKLDKSRKTGFKCPRGCGKGSNFSTACPGRIDKSHPIFPRNETKKNKAPPLVPEVGACKTKKDKEGAAASPPPPAAVVAPAANGGKQPKPSKPEDAKKDAAGPKAPKATATTAAAATATAAASVAVAPGALGGPPAAAQNGAVARAENGALAKQQLLEAKEAKAALRRDLGLERGLSGTGAAGVAGNGAALMATKAAAAGAGTAGGAAAGGPAAWVRGGAAAAVVAAAAAPADAPAPALHTLAQYPQLQQLFKAPKPSPAAAATPAAPAPAAAPPLQSQQHFPPVKAATSPAGARPLPLPLPILTPCADPPATSSPSPLLLLLQPQRAAAAAPAPAAAPSTASPSTPPPPPPPRRTSAGGASTAAPFPATSTLSSSPSPGPGPGSVPAAGTSGLPVGMEYAEQEQELDPSKLTKAQKKNLKRAERKKKVAQEGDAVDSHSHASSDVARDLDRSEHAVLREEMFVQALVCRKTVTVLQELRRLAFTDWQAAAAVQRHGGDVASCVAWLLEHAEQDMEAMGAVSGAALPGGASRALPVVDVSEEVRALGELQAGLGIGADTVQAAVVEALGEVSLAIELMLDGSKALGGGHGGGALGVLGAGGGGLELCSSDGAGSSEGDSVHSAVANWRSSCTAALQMQPAWAADNAPHVPPQYQQYGGGTAPVNGTMRPGQTLSEVERGCGGSSRLAAWAGGAADPSASAGQQRYDGAGLMVLLGARQDSVAGHSDGGFTLHDWVPGSGAPSRALSAAAAAGAGPGASQRSTLSETRSAEDPTGAGFSGFALGLGGRSLFGGFAVAPSGTSTS